MEMKKRQNHGLDGLKNDTENKSVKSMKISGSDKGYKQTDVGVIPADWEVKKLGEIFTFSGGYSASREQLSNDGFCYLHYGDIHGAKKTFINVINEYTEIPKLKISLKNVSPKSLLNDGDIVFVDASEDDEGTSRHLIVKNSDGIPYISGLHTIVAKSKDDSLDNDFKRYCFQTKVVKNQFKFYAVGTKVSGISKTNIAKIEIAIPTKTEQTAIAASLSDADALIQSLEKLIAKKRLIKQGAMQELLKPKKRWAVKKLGEIAEIDSENLGSDTKSNYSFKYISLEDVDCGTLRGCTEQVFYTAPSRARRKIRRGDVLISTVRPNLKSHLLIKNDIVDTIPSVSI
jgi:restriction endonuclease S subunit